MASPYFGQTFEILYKFAKMVCKSIQNKSRRCLSSLCTLSFKHLIINQLTFVKIVCCLQFFTRAISWVKKCLEICNMADQVWRKNNACCRHLSSRKHSVNKSSLSSNSFHSTQSFSRSPRLHSSCWTRWSTCRTKVCVRTKLICPSWADFNVIKLLKWSWHSLALEKNPSCVEDSYIFETLGLNLIS